MKKAPIILGSLMLSAALLLTACGGGEGPGKPGETGTSRPQSTPSEAKPESKAATEATEALTDWGVGPEEYFLQTIEEYHAAQIKFPELLGNQYGTAKMGQQPDGTLVMFDVRWPDEIPEEVGSVDEVFPAYFVQANRNMEKYRDLGWDNFSFEITEQEHLTVNGYEMCKYRGVHRSTDDMKAAWEFYYVAYAAAVNEGKDYVYWIVLDNSDDQSLRDTVEYNADMMAKTLSERKTDFNN